MRAHRFPILILCLLSALSAVVVWSCGGRHNPVQPTCTYTVSTTSLTFEAGGGPAQLTVTTTSGCTWTAQSNAAWLTVANGASGTGNGTVQVTAAANTANAARSATLTVATQTVQATQAGRPACTYLLSPTAATVDQDGGTGTFGVDTASYCTWTATSGASWLTITSGATGTGPGQVGYTAARNTDTDGRSTTVVVADQTFGVSQAGDVLSCQYSLSEVNFTPCMPRIEMSSVITTQAACPWTLTTDVPWLTITGPESGTGSATLRFQAAENYDAPRVGRVLVRWPAPTAGQNLHVAQAGCYYAVTKDTFSFAAGGGSGTFDVLQQSDPYTCGGPLQDACIWSAVSSASWITVTSSMPRAGDNPVAFTVAPNGTGSPRTATITVRNKTVTINQGS